MRRTVYRGSINCFELENVLEKNGGLDGESVYRPKVWASAAEH